MRIRKSAAYLIVATGVCVYLNNASWLVSPSESEISLIAHRGVHQTYPKFGLENDTCTADRIHNPSHAFLENTLESMAYAFESGADVVEIDVHPTTDGRFAVFHDWTIDCRTDGSGVTRGKTLAYLQSLDIGYGYTADGGRTFPFRGLGVGKMPSLLDVFDNFESEQHKFLINIKSNTEGEGDLLADFLLSQTEQFRSRIMVYGGHLPVTKLLERVPDVSGFSRPTVKSCLKNYAFKSWTGYMPKECQNTVLLIPIDYARFLWGWPRKFMQRMESKNTMVILTGWEDGRTDGIDNADDIDRFSEDFSGLLWTDKIEVVGPQLKQNRP